VTIAGVAAGVAIGAALTRMLIEILTGVFDPPPDVLPATAVAIATKRSWQRQYFDGSAAPPGQALSRRAGMCVCSAK